MEEMSSALNEIPSNRSTKNVEAANVAREKGWIEPESYDYSKYNNSGPPGPLPNIPEEGAPQEQENVPQWAAQAAKYEWKDEYGDIGPAVPELENALFRNEYINRQGLKLDK